MSEETALALPCIRCGKQLRNAMSMQKGVPETNQPYNGTAFVTNGHYGSTVFDEFHGERIEINVCDVCLLDAAKENRVLSYRAIQRWEYSEREFWVPDVDEERVREIDRKRHQTTKGEQDDNPGGSARDA